MKRYPGSFRLAFAAGVILFASAFSLTGWSPAGAGNASPAGHHSDSTLPVAGSAQATASSPYAETYDPMVAIRSLSSEEIGQIEKGEGAGFALPAELNGVPGPRHVLTLANELDLSFVQRTGIQAVYDAFLTDALPAGERYLFALQTLEADFRAGTVSAATLPERVAEVSRLEGELMTIHLTAHLETAAILTSTQIDTYNQLRGYR